MWPLKFIKVAYRKDGDRPFVKACSDRTRSDVCKLKRFRLEIRDFFLCEGDETERD